MLSGRPESEKYTAGLPHATTIIWLRLSPKEILVAVDSRSTQLYNAHDTCNKRKYYDVLVGDEESKFTSVCGGVYASLCGSAHRCFKMIDYIKRELKDRKMEKKLQNIGTLGVEYLKNNPIHAAAKHRKCTVHFCAWMSDKKEYEIILVKDGLPSSVPVKVDVFGCGSGSGLGLDILERFKSRRNVEGLMEEMMRAVLRDPHTGGLIKVYRLAKDGRNTISEPIRAATFLDELYGPNGHLYEGMVFNERTMFVIIMKKDERIMSRMDILRYLRVGQRDAKWFTHTDLLMVYLIEFPSSNHRDQFLPDTDPEKIVCRINENLDKKSCKCIFGHANRSVLDRALQFNDKHTEDLYKL